MPNPPWTHNTVYLLTLIGTANGAQIVNTHHFEASGAHEAGLLTDTDAFASSEALADDWIANAKTAWLACHSNDYKLDMVKAQVIERPGNWRHRLSPVEKPLTTANVGAAASASKTQQAAVDIKWRTVVASKRTRGRMYVGPIPDIWETAGQLSGGGPAAYAAYVTAIKTNYIDVTVPVNAWPLAIYSRPYNLGEYQYTIRVGGDIVVVKPPEYAGNSTFVTTGVVDPILRTQRRRVLGVGS